MKYIKKNINIINWTFVNISLFFFFFKFQFMASTPNDSFFIIRVRHQLIFDVDGN